MTQIVTTPAVVADLQASFDALANQLHGLLQEVSGAAAADAAAAELLSGKVTEALAAIESVRAGVEANGGHLTALSASVAADFDDLRTILTDLLAAVAAIPAVDTAALEQLIAANNEAIGVVLDVVNGISEAQDAAMSELTALASAVAGIVGTVDSIAGAVSGIATDIASIKDRLDVLEAGNPGGGDPDPEPAPVEPEQPEPGTGTNIPMGVNVHEGVEPAYPLSQTERRIQMVAAANIRSYRNDMRHIENTAEVNRLINLCRQYGVILRPMLYPTTEAKAYNYAKLFGDRVKVWEIGNEVNLRGRDGAEGRIDALVATYRGMKRASDEFNLGLKFTINVTSCNSNHPSSRCYGDVTGDTWFLDMARARGFLFDYVSFHHYSHFTDSQYWLDLYLGQLRGFAERYNTKIFLNETNAGEVYNGALGSEPIYAQSVRKFLTELNAKYSDVIAEINMYELIDEPHLTVEVEKHFGMFFNIDTPKPVWEVVKEFASQSRAIEEMPGKPQPAPEPEPEPDPEPALLPLAGFNAAGLGNNPEYAPGSENSHFRTFARRAYQADYVTAWAGHLQPELGDRFLIRIPYALERLFVISGGVPVLQESYAALIEEVMNQAGEHGGLALLDAHNYCRWWQTTPKKGDGSLKYPALQRRQGTIANVTIDKQWFPFGHPGCDVTYAIVTQMYVKIAQRFGSNPHLFGYGLMNEPHGRGAQDDGIPVEANWIANAQLLVDAVRSVDSKNWIAVGGGSYSSPKRWRAVSDGLRNIVGEKIIYEAHQYPDENGGGGGQWKKGLVHSIDPAARVNDWTDFLDWCAEVGRPALAGEYGAPITAEKWTANSGGTFEYSYTVQGAAEYLEQLNAMFDSRRVPRTQWLAGPGDADNYANGMDKNDGTLKPNANALFDRLGNTVEAYGPTAF